MSPFCCPDPQTRKRNQPLFSPLILLGAQTPESFKLHSLLSLASQFTISSVHTLCLSIILLSLLNGIRSSLSVLDRPGIFLHWPVFQQSCHPLYVSRATANSLPMHFYQTKEMTHIVQLQRSE